MFVICEIWKAWLETKINMESYNKEIKPDYVVVLYAHVGDSSEMIRYNFL